MAGRQYDSVQGPSLLDRQNEQMAGKAVGGHDLGCGGGRCSAELFKCAFISRTPVVPDTSLASHFYYRKHFSSHDHSSSSSHSSSLFYILDLLLYSFTQTIVFSTLQQPEIVDARVPSSILAVSDSIPVNRFPNLLSRNNCYASPEVRDTSGLSLRDTTNHDHSLGVPWSTPRALCILINKPQYTYTPPVVPPSPYMPYGPTQSPARSTKSQNCFTSTRSVSHDGMHRWSYVSLSFYYSLTVGRAASTTPQPKL